MPDAREPFPFLTTEEFNRLSPEEKMSYLQEASAILSARSAETARLLADLLGKPSSEPDEGPLTGSS